MNTIVIYKSKYGSTKQYAEWIAEELGCGAVSARDINAAELEKYDNIIFGGGMYSESIDGVSLITKNFDKLSDKKVVIFTVGLTDPGHKKYYKSVADRNLSREIQSRVKIFNLPGKMIMEELSFVHRKELGVLKAVLSKKTDLSEDGKLLLELCGKSNDFTDKDAIAPIVAEFKK